MEWIIDIYSNMNDHQNNYAEWKKTDNKKLNSVWLHSYKILGDAK